MAQKMKQVSMTLTVSVPTWMTAACAKREVRSLINDQCNYLSSGPYFEEVTVKVKKISKVGA